MPMPANLWLQCFSENITAEQICKAAQIPDDPTICDILWQLAPVMPAPVKHWKLGRMETAVRHTIIHLYYKEWTLWQAVKALTGEWKPSAKFFDLAVDMETMTPETGHETYKELGYKWKVFPAKEKQHPAQPQQQKPDTAHLEPFFKFLESKGGWGRKKGAEEISGFKTGDKEVAFVRREIASYVANHSKAVVSSKELINYIYENLL